MKTLTDGGLNLAAVAENLLNTIYIIGLTLLIAVPFGVGIAVYLSEYARPGRMTKLAEFLVETLAGIPSVMFGVFGMTIFGRIPGIGNSLLCGALTLSLMVLPFIVSNTLEAVRNVPEGYRAAALGLGATKGYMIRTVLLPAAQSGIRTGIFLAVGRIIGESTALLLTAGEHKTLAAALYFQVQAGDHEAAFAIGCVLLALVFLFNVLMCCIAAKER